MFTLKKSLLLLFFIGTISLSLCKQERSADEDEGEVIEQEVKRGLMNTASNVLTNVAGTVMDKIKCRFTGGC
uniref:Host defense peptide ranatuerin-2-OM n=1 Tax=Odorrana margaretae TaxID=121156 RepID=A0A067XKS7_ODOMA|nr:host defense peptide ranatuerin-2-OM [Odorrana margaretae]